MGNNMGTIRTAALAALLAFTCTAAAATGPMRVTIGDTTLALPVDEGYVDAATVAPALFASLQENLGKQDIVPAAALVTGQDAERLKASLPSRDFLYVYATIKSLANVHVDDRDWAVGRRVIPRAIAQVDIDKQTDEMEARMSREATEKAGIDAKIDFGSVGAPVIVPSDPESVRFSMAFPITTTVAGESDRRVLGVECAIVHLKEKLVAIYVYRDRENDEQARALRTALDGAVTRLRALNP
jgi:hypothetical protein